MVADEALYNLSFPQFKQPPVPAGEAYPAPHVVQNPFADVVPAVKPFGLIVWCRGCGSFRWWWREGGGGEKEESGEEVEERV